MGTGKAALSVWLPERGGKRGGWSGLVVCIISDMSWFDGSIKRISWYTIGVGSFGWYIVWYVVRFIFITSCRHKNDCACLFLKIQVDYTIALSFLKIWWVAPWSVHYRDRVGLMDLGNAIICDDQNDILVSDSSHTWLEGDNRWIWLTLAVGFVGCGWGCGTAKVLVCGRKGGFDLSCPFWLMKAVATTASFRHLRQP